MTTVGWKNDNRHLQFCYAGASLCKKNIQSNIQFIF